MSIHDLYINGFLNESIKKGILLPTIVPYCKIKTVFLEMRTKYGYEEAIEKTADKQCTSISTVKRALAIVSKD